MAIKVANNQSLTAITALPAAITSGAMTLLSTQTASSSSTITFDSNIDSTYSVYLFKFIDVHPSNDGVGLYVNFRDGSTAYDATKTTTFFYNEHTESDSSTALGYSASSDLAQSTSAQKLAGNIGNDNDQSASGELWLFAPSDTTYVKHFFGKANEVQADDRISNVHYAGYCNVTSAIDGVQFSISAGTIDTGTFKLYGVS